MSDKKTILICDDDRDIVTALKIYLKTEGYHILTAYNGQEAIDQLHSHEVHLVLLDLMMPIMDGITATKKIREFSNVPIIHLTAKSQDHEKVMGLNLGADDYIVKPFNPTELIARIRSQLRRFTNLGGLKVTDNILSSGSLTMNTEIREVKVDQKTIALTPIEFNILKLLLENPGKVFSSSDIYEHVWQTPSYGADGTVAVHIRHLREKIEINPAEPKLIKVIWGQGYRIEDLPVSEN